MKIIWVDNEPLQITHGKLLLEDNKHSVEVVLSPEKALEQVTKNKYDLAILDIMMDHKLNTFDIKETGGKMETGRALARKLLQIDGELKIIGCSARPSSEIQKWFRDYCNGFISKENMNSRSFVRKIENAVKGVAFLNIFIVHGHDNQILFELKNLLQNKLNLPEPIVLREQPSLGKTIIEKFEYFADEADIVFVLMSPDDIVENHSGVEIRRARQNVIFELGYFYGRLQRQSGRVILIYKGNLEIPSDIAGILYIHTNSGIDEISQKIRDELIGYV